MSDPILRAGLLLAPLELVAVKLTFATMTIDKQFLKDRAAAAPAMAGGRLAAALCRGNVSSSNLNLFGSSIRYPSLRLAFTQM